MIGPIALAAMLVLPVTQASAMDLIRGDIRCSAIVEMVDSGDKQAIGYAGQFFVDVMVEAERPYLQKKRGGVIAPLSSEGLAGAVAAAIGECRQTPKDMARATALSVYDGMRGIESALGVVKR